MLASRDMSTPNIHQRAPAALYASRHLRNFRVMSSLCTILLGQIQYVSRKLTNVHMPVAIDPSVRKAISVSMLGLSMKSEETSCVDRQK